MHVGERATVKQATLAIAADQGVGFERYRKPVRREASFAQMATGTPWVDVGALSERRFPKLRIGRPPSGLQRTLLIHLLQHRLNLAGEATEASLYDSAVLSSFVVIGVGCVPLSYATSLLRFRDPTDWRRAVPGYLRHGRPTAARPWAAPVGRNDRRCHADCCAQFH